MKKQLHIAIISPSDVLKERDIVEEVCDELNLYIKKYKIEIVHHRYENYPPNYHVDPQTRFEEYHHFDNTDIFIAILWYRIGTVLVDKFKSKMTNISYVTGTQYEIETAISSKKPLWIYHKMDDDSIPMSKTIEVGKQKEQLSLFLSEIGIGLGNAKHSYHKFNGDEFKISLRYHIKEELEKRYKIKILLPKCNLSSISPPTGNQSIHPNYLVGLYGFLVITTLILFVWVEKSDLIHKDVKNFINLYTTVFFAIMAIVVQGLPIHYKDKRNTFREVFYALLKRAMFIMLFAILLSLFFWFLILWLMKDIPF